MVSKQAQDCIQSSGVDINALARMAEMKPDDLLAMKDDDLANAIKNGLEQKQLAKYRAMLRELALNDLLGSFEAAVKNKTGKAREKAAEDWFQGTVTTDYSRRGLAGASAEQLAGGYRNLAMQAITDLSDTLDPGVIFTPRELPRINESIARYLHGESDAIAEPRLRKSLDAWLKTAEGMRERFNALGGNVGKIEGWGLRHHWDSAKIGQVSKEEWVNAMEPLLDPSKYINVITGTQADTAKVRVVLEETYDNIIAGYHGQIKPGFVDMPGVIAQRNKEERHLHFKDGAAWWEAAKQFGDGDENTAVLRSMYNYIHDLSTDTALIEKFGPSAAQTFNYISDTVAKTVGRDTLQHQNTKFAFSNLANQDRSVQGWMKEFGAGLRSFEVATKLGSATLSAVSDFAFTRAVSKDLGLSFGKIMGEYTSLMAGKSTTDIRKMGIVADYMSRNMARSNRYADDWGSGTLSWLADKTMRLSGMNRHQHSAMMAFQLELLGHLGGMSGKSFDQLDPKIRQFFTAYGLKASDWDAMRGTVDEGFILPVNIADKSVAARVLGAVMEETRYAVFEPGARERAVITQGTERGTFKGELMRFLGLFKSFPIGITTLHGTRAMAKESGVDRLKYAGSVLLLSTILGAIVIQSKELSKGRSPRNMDAEFLLASFLQGGSGGILMDIAGKEHYSSSALLEDLAGPALSDLAKFTKGSQDVAAALLTADGDALADAYSDTVNRVSKDIPFTSIWYTRYLLQQQFFDAIRSAVDPKYDERRYGLEGWMKEQDRELYY